MTTKPKMLSADYLKAILDNMLEDGRLGANSLRMHIENQQQTISALEAENARLRGVLETIDQNWGTQIATSQEGGSFDNKLHIYIQNRLAALKEGGTNL